MWTLLGKILGGVAGMASAAQAERSRQNAAQSRINEAEIANAPASFLRLWRGALGWTLTLLFVWEVVGRMLLVPLFFPAWGKTLPPPVLEQIMALLLGMLGLSF